MSKAYVVVGNGVAGMGVAEALRRASPQADIGCRHVGHAARHFGHMAVAPT